MRLKYLGSGAAECIPALFCTCDLCTQARELQGKDIRARACMLVDGKTLIDFTPDMFFNSIRYNLRLWDIDNVVITHSHIDHFSSSELCLKSSCYARVPDKKRPKLYANANCLKELERMSRFDTGQPADFFDLIRVNAFMPFQVGDVVFTPLPAQHMDHEDAFVYLLEQGNLSFLYCNDTAYPPQETLHFLKGKRLDIISMDCSYGASGAKGATHMNFDDNLRLKKELLSSGCVHSATRFYLSHIAHHVGMTHEQLSRFVGAYGFTVAWDGLEVI